MTAFQRLLKYPHQAVFDKQPHAVPVLRVQHADGASWEVAEETLRVRAGEEEHSFDLSELTIAALVTALNGVGFTADLLDAEYGVRKGAVLVEGSGAEPETLQAYTNPLWVLLGSYAREVRAARDGIDDAVSQMDLSQAGDYWLDLWGHLLGDERKIGEEDDDYRPRIVPEVLRLRLNGIAIEQAILDQTGKKVLIEEPWGEMFMLDASQVSGGHRFYNGEFVGPHLILPVSYEAIDWTDVLKVIERNRAAGVIVLPPETRLQSVVDSDLSGNIWTGHSSYMAQLVRAWDENRLDQMILSGEEITLNYGSINEERHYVVELPAYPATIYSEAREMIGFAWGEMGGWVDFPWVTGDEEIDAFIDVIEGWVNFVNVKLPEDIT